ncbi:MAG: ABC transporter permease [Gemmatimonadales bacterium]
MLADLVPALRSIRKHPVFSVIVILTLGLAIGVNSVVFGLVNAFFLRPLPVSAPEQLVNIYSGTPDNRYGALSYPDYRDLRDNAASLGDVVGYSGLMVSLSSEGSAESLFGEIVTGNYFSVLGVNPAIGRAFSPDEDAASLANPVAVISHRLWQRRFGADPGAIGRTATLNGRQFTIIGVAPASFRGLLFSGLASDLWVPAAMMGAVRTDQREDRGERWLFVKARLHPGVAIERVRSELTTLGSRLAQAHPASNQERAFAVARTVDVAVHPDGDRAAIPAAGLLLVAVGGILLVACANLANLMLARGSARRREIAIRLALGSSRTRVVRLLVIENGVLALMGGAFGLGVAHLIARAVATFRPPGPVPLSLDIGVDLRVIGYTMLITIGATILFALLPALRTTRPDLAPSLSDYDAAPGGRIGRLRHALLVPQVALTLALLVLAGLFSRSVARAHDVDPGFAIDRTAMVALHLAQSGYDEPRAIAFWRAMHDRMQSVAGVTSTSVTERIPLDLYGNQTTTLIDEQGISSTIQVGRVDANYLATMGIAVTQGRGFDRADVEQDLPVALISEAAAQKFWPGQSPLGRRIRQGGSDQPVIEVIGVVADAKVSSLGESPTPFLYRPLADGHSGLLRLIVSTTGDAGATARAAREAVAAIDPTVAVIESTTMAAHLGIMLFPFRTAAALGSALGLFGLIIAVVGLYGVVAFAVARRSRELAIRAALGAPAGRIVSMLLGDVLRPALIGAGVGLALAWASTRLLTGYLFGISALDPVTFGGVTVGLLAVIVAAAATPARRAGSIAPTAALRD